MENNNKNAMRKFILWILCGIIVFIVGMINTYASEYAFDYSYTQTYYDNYGYSVSNVGASWNESLQAYVSNNITTTANSYGAGVAFNSPIPLLENHTYTMSISFLDKSNLALSSKNYISVADSAWASANDYANGDYGTQLLYSKATNGSILSYAFKVTNNHTYIFVPFTTTYTTTQNYIMTSVVIDDLGSEGISQTDINNSLNNQTTIINNSINNLENSINNNINNMEESINDNIKENLNSCRNSVNLINLPTQSISNNGITATFSNGEIILNGTNNSGSNANINIPINTVTAGKTISLSANNSEINSNVRFRLQSGANTNATITMSSINAKSENKTLQFDFSQLRVIVATGTTLNNFKFKPQLELGSVATEWEKYDEEICKNKIDEAEETRKGILATIKNLPNALGEMLKGLFIPDDEEMEELIEGFKTEMQEQFGILYDGINLVVQFVNNFIDLTENEDVIIHIPEVTVPNFEDNVIIEEQDFNWSYLLRNKESINTLWEIYLSFMDVILIIAFLNQCENIFKEMMGQQKESIPDIYESEGESYDVDDRTGEVSNHRVWRKESRRKK